MTQIPTLAQLIKHALENRLLDVHTALIAKVECYDAEKQLIDASVVQKRHLKNLDGEWTSEELPLLCDVPVLFPRAGGFFISFPIRSGDFVQVIFNETDFEEWLEEKDPGIAYNQRFTLQGAVAIPGIYPQSRALPDAHKTNFVLGQEQGLQIHMDDEKIRLGSAEASEALAIASKVREELDNIKSAYNKHSHFPPGGPIKTTDALLTSSDIATKKVVAQ